MGRIDILRGIIEQDVGPYVGLHELLQELDRMEPAWQSLSGYLSLPTQEIAWIRASALSIHRNDRMKIVSWADSRGVGAVAALAKGRRDILGASELIGVKYLNEPVDLIYRDDQALEGLISALARMRQPFVLRRVPAESASVGALKRAFNGKAMIVCRSDFAFPSITLDESWCMPERKLSKRRASDFRRSRRRAEEFGEVRSEVIAPKPGELSDTIRMAMEIEQSGWKGRVGTSLLRDPRRAAFYEEYAKRECSNGRLRIAYLYLGTRAVAMQVAVEYQDRFWLLKIGYNDEYAKCSPGILLLAETIRYAAERGLKSYEFLGGPAPWISAWADREKQCVTLRVYPCNILGVIGLGRDSVMAGLRRLADLFGQQVRLDGKGATPREPDGAKCVASPGTVRWSFRYKSTG